MPITVFKINYNMFEGGWVTANLIYVLTIISFMSTVHFRQVSQMVLLQLDFDH